MKSLSVFVLFALAGHSLSQKNFIVNVINYQGSNFNVSTLLCYGTIISEKHVLVPASCVYSVPVQNVGIAAVLISPSKNETVFTSTEKISIHSDFLGNLDYKANVAVIKTSKNLDPNGSFRSLSLGKLDSNGTYSVFGWGGNVVNPRREAVVVYQSQFCDPRYPQSFCSVFDSLVGACVSQLGSPLVSRDTESTAVDGFVISKGYCFGNSTKYSMYYHNVGDFNDWIKKQVSGAESFAKISILLILSTFLISFL